MSLELIDLASDTNLRGPYVLMRNRPALNRSRKTGRMVNIFRWWIQLRRQRSCPLLNNQVSHRSHDRVFLAVEWARYNINVNAIAPGAFESEMMDGMLERLGILLSIFHANGSAILLANGQHTFVFSVTGFRGGNWNVHKD